MAPRLISEQCSVTLETHTDCVLEASWMGSSQFSHALNAACTDRIGVLIFKTACDQLLRPSAFSFLPANVHRKQLIDHSHTPPRAELSQLKTASTRHAPIRRKNAIEASVLGATTVTEPCRQRGNSLSSLAFRYSARGFRQTCARSWRSSSPVHRCPLLRFLVCRDRALVATLGVRRGGANDD